MANKSINMLKLRQILRYYTQGTSKKQISVITAVARNTVKSYISRFISLHITYEDIASLSDHELEKLFIEPNPKLPDERFDRLQQLLPEIEKQMSVKASPCFNYGSNMLRLMHLPINIPSLRNTITCIAIVSGQPCIWSIKPVIKCILILQVINYP